MNGWKHGWVNRRMYDGYMSGWFGWIYSSIFYFINNHTAWVVKGTLNLELKPQVCVVIAPTGQFISGQITKFLWIFFICSVCVGGGVVMMCPIYIISNVELRENKVIPSNVLRNL